MYILFTFDTYYPYGGFGDVAGVYETLDAAKSADVSSDNAQIVFAGDGRMTLVLVRDSGGEWAESEKTHIVEVSPKGEENWTHVKVFFGADNSQAVAYAKHRSESVVGEVFRVRSESPTFKAVK